MKEAMTTCGTLTLQLKSVLVTELPLKGDCSLLLAVMFSSAVPAVLSLSPVPGSV